MVGTDIRAVVKQVERQLEEVEQKNSEEVPKGANVSNTIKNTQKFKGISGNIQPDVAQKPAVTGNIRKTDADKNNNPMRQIRLEKVILNIGVGDDQEKLKRAQELMSLIINKEQVPKITTAKKRLPAWGLRPGLAIGVKVTLRGGRAKRYLTLLLAAKQNKILRKSFQGGFFSFGIPEYLDIKTLKYDPKLGVMGLEVAVVLSRPGFRVERRQLSGKIGKAHKISKEETVEFAKLSFGVEVIEG